MSFFESVNKKLENIKKFFENRFRNVKELQSGEKEIEIESSKKSQDFRNKLEVNSSEIDFRNLSNLDRGILQYMDSYYNEWKKNENQKISFISSYDILVGINAEIQESGNNLSAEKYLIDYINQNANEFSLAKQPPKGEPMFYHILHGEGAVKNIDQNNKIRLYLNTDRKNVASLAMAIIAEFKDEDYYFKISSDKQMSERKRTEKIVFYTDGEKVNNICEKLKQLKQSYPNLFTGSEKTNPFLMKDDGFISISKEPNTNWYNDLRGNKFEISPTSNKFIAEALRDSFTMAMKDVIKDNSLANTRKLPEYDLNSYMKLYKKIMKKCPNELLRKMKEYLVKSYHNNRSIDIHGLDKIDRDNKKNQGIEL